MARSRRRISSRSEVPVSSKALKVVDARVADNATLDERAEQDAEQDRDLVEMNGRYAVVKIGGKTRVVSLEDSPAYPGSVVPVFSTIPDFCAFHAKHKKIIAGDKGDLRKVGIGKWWI